MRYKELIEDKLNGLTVMSLNLFVDSSSPSEPDEPDVSNELDDATIDELTEANFGLGSTYRVAKSDEMQDYLNRVKTKTKNKVDKYKMPYVHGSNITVVNDAGKKYDLESLKQEITTRPTSLLKQNEKMKHSNGTATVYYNVGLPALKGLAVNENTGEFVIVDTCPGAGTCKTYCYAMKGSYVMFKNVSMKQTQTLNFLLNDPKGFENELKKEIATVIAKWRKFSDSDLKKGSVAVAIRWHDAGDFFSPEYMNAAFDVARAFPDNDFYAYTKMAKVANAPKPTNFKINFSSGALPSQEKQVDLTQIKHAIVVPKDMFRGKLTLDADKKWQWNSASDFEIFKNELATKYKINPKSILTYDEFITKPKSDIPIWNVIVKPGEGDTSANSQSVIGTYLLFH